MQPKTLWKRVSSVTLGVWKSFLGLSPTPKCWLRSCKKSRSRFWAIRQACMCASGSMCWFSPKHLGLWVRRGSDSCLCLLRPSNTFLFRLASEKQGKEAEKRAENAVDLIEINLLVRCTLIAHWCIWPFVCPSINTCKPQISEIEPIDTANFARGGESGSCRSY